jgi:CHAD domain-containing protein
MQLMIQGKWISDLTAETRVADAARRVLTLRLEAVRDGLGRALREAGQDTEHVHQLRVATRRASAALEVFADCLPARVFRDARRQLGKIRRAAGEARDWDVFLARLIRDAAEQSPEDRASFEMLMGYAMAHRIPAQGQLASACPEYPFGFERFMAETVGAIRAHGPGRNSMAAFAKPLLAGMLADLNEAAAGDLGDYRQLHGVRIVGKRLRYAMEVFADCCGPAVRRKLYPAVAEMQEILGSVNDHFNARELFMTLDANLGACLPQACKRYQGVIARMSQRHEAQMAGGRQKFQQWWQRWQQPEIQIAVAEIRAPAGCRCRAFPGAEGPAVTPVGEAAAVAEEEQATVKKIA